MTRSTNARLAGFSFLFYIAIGIASLVLSGRAKGGEGVAAKLASIAQHATDLQLTAIFTLLTSLSAFALAISLWALTRDEDPDLAMFALACRVAEGLAGGLAVKGPLGLLWLATATGAHAPGSVARGDLAAFLLWGQGGNPAAFFFAVGSTVFCWLLLRGRMLPAWLAWLGLVTSALLVLALPLDLVDAIPGAIVNWLWLPMAAFEIPFGVLLLVKGLPLPAKMRAA
jgi:hypothetical protein